MQNTLIRLVLQYKMQFFYTALRDVCSTLHCIVIARFDITLLLIIRMQHRRYNLRPSVSILLSSVFISGDLIIILIRINSD